MKKGNSKEIKKILSSKISGLFLIVMCIWLEYISIKCLFEEAMISCQSEGLQRLILDAFSFENKCL